MHENGLPLLTFQPGTLAPFRRRIANDDDSDDDGDPGHPRRWYHYVPLTSESRNCTPHMSSTQPGRKSRHPASSSAASIHPIRPAQLPLSDPACAGLLHRAPPRHLHPLLPRLQLTHRLRRARPRANPGAQVGGGSARRGWRSRKWRRRGRDESPRRTARRALGRRLHPAGKVVPHLLEAEARARAPLLPVWALCP
jgi:hypothetical protein